MKEELKGKLIAAGAVFLGVCITASTVMSVFSLTTIGKLKDEVSAINGNPQDVNQENDVTIMSQYTIRSTEKISDAYKRNSDSGLDDREKETLKLATDVLNEIIRDDMTDYEKEKAVYDWLIENVGQDKGLLTVIPSSDKDSDNPYGVLKYHNAVCVGYATTFRLFMQMMDIECMVVHNTERYHSWNLVKLDGKWYHTDVYSDSETGNYANFNMNDEIASRSHDWNKEFFPAADGTEYCYAFMNREEAKDLYDIPRVIKKKLDEEEYVFTIGFKTPPANNDAVLADTIMNSLTERILVDNPDAYLEWNWYMDDDNNFVLFVSISITNTTEEGVTPEQAEKIGRKIGKAFGDDESWSVSYYPSEDRNDDKGMKEKSVNIKEGQ